MYANYIYNTSSTQAQILSDVVAILTGETDKNNLSASCDKTNTSITSVISAGWTVHDASAGTNAQCLKAPYSDDVDHYKYVVIDTNTDGNIYTKLYETWNAGAHTGTNLTNYSDNQYYCQRYNRGAGGTIKIFSSARQMVLVGHYSSSYGSSNHGGIGGIFERTRALPFDTTANNYPKACFAHFGIAMDHTYGPQNANTFTPRLIDKLRAEKTGSNAVMSMIPFPFGDWTNMANGATQLVPQEVSNTYLPFLPIYLSGYLTGANLTHMPVPYGEISSLCDVWAIPIATAAHNDTAVKGSKNYVILKGHTNSPEKCIALRAE